MVSIQAQTKHDGKLLNTMFTNMRNDIETLNICIKALRQCIEEGKHAYAKCNLAYIHL